MFLSDRTISELKLFNEIINSLIFGHLKLDFFAFLSLYGNIHFTVDLLRFFITSRFSKTHHGSDHPTSTTLELYRK